MIGAVWNIQWNNPYTKPPEGMPRVLAEFFFPSDDPRARICPDEVMEYYNHHNLFGSGYDIHWQSVSAPPKIISQENLSSIRKKRLERRVKKKYPLFAEQFIAEEIEAKHDYYSGITDSQIEQRRASVLEEEQERLQRLLEERVIIHWKGTKDNHDRGKLDE